MDRIIDHGESEPMKTDTPEITTVRKAIPAIDALSLVWSEAIDIGKNAELWLGLMKLLLLLSN